MTVPSEIIRAAQTSHAAFYPLGPFASISIAQWALESGWGKSLSGANNCFGIKATKAQIAAGQATLRMTHETLHGVYQAIPQYFANYPTLEACFTAHAQLLATSPYYVKAQHAVTPDDYAMALQGIYATGIPGHPYGPALIDIMKQNNLYQYDQPTGVTPMTNDTVTAATAALPDVTVHAPTVSQAATMDWGSVAAQIIDHAKPIAEKAAEVGVAALFHEIPFGFFLQNYITPKLIDQYVDMAFAALEGQLVGQTVALPTEGIAGIAANLFAKNEGALLGFLSSIGVDVMPMITKAVMGVLAKLKLS